MSPPYSSLLVCLATVAPTVVVAQSTGSAVQLEDIQIDAAHKGRGDKVRDPAVAPINGYVAKDSATGTKTSTPLIETPQSVSVIGSQQIRDFKAQTIDQALNYSSGVKSGFFGVDTRNDWFLIRGFPAQISGYYLDGLQVFSPDFGTFKLEPFGMERIEVLKGPASVLYGGSNTGGIVNAVSKRPPPTFSGTVESGINNYGNKYFAFDIGGPVTPKSDNQFYYRVEGYARGGGTQVDFTKDDRIYISPSLTWAPDAATTITFLSSYQKDNTNGANFLPYAGTVVPAPFGKIPTNVFTSEPDYDYFHREQAFVGYSAEHKFSNQLSVRQNLRYSDLQVHAQTVYGNGYSGAPATANLARLNFTEDPHVGEFTVDNQAEAHFNTGPLGHTLLGGIDFKHAVISDDQNFALGSTLNLLNPIYTGAQRPATFSIYKNTQDQLGEYLQDQIKVDRFTLVLGGRHDSLHTALQNVTVPTSSGTREDDALTGRVGLIYTSSLGVAPYVTYANSFDPQLGFNTNTKQALKPMTGQLYEAGVKYQPIGPNLLINAALFDLTQQNVLSTDPTFVLGSTQTGEEKSRGFEIETEATLSDGFKALGSFTAYDIKNTKDPLDPAGLGKVPVRVPEVIGALYLDYTIQTGALKGFGFGAGPRYTGKSYADSANQFAVPATIIADAGLHYERDHWRAALNVRNVFDKTFVAGCSSVNACFYGERRTALVSLAYSW